MKILELHRLNISMAVKVIVAYTCSKLLRIQLIKQQNELISYFNHLAKLNLYHKKVIGKYFLVASFEYGQFYLRKPYSSDYKVFEQVFLEKEYLRLAQLVELNCTGDTVTMIDGGANIGLTTIFLYQFFKGKKTVVSIIVEPFEDNIASAKLNFQVQGIDTVFYEEAGLLNKRCFLKIDHNFRDGMEWSVQIVESPVETNLKSIEISEIFNKYQLSELDVLKLDIEGAEKFLFEDEAYASDFLKKVKIIAIELHDEYHIAEKILNILTNNSFDLIKFGEMYIGTKKQALS